MIPDNLQNISFGALCQNTHILLTERIKDAGKLMGIELKDHLIVVPGGGFTII